MMLLNLPLRESVIIDGGDEKFIEDLKIYALTIKGNSEERLKQYLLRTDEKRIGFIKCSVLAPQNLKVPVLCVKLCGKLLAPLCRTCAMDQCKNI